VNVDRMMRSMLASLAYYGEQFGPYQYKQLRIVEFPRRQAGDRSHRAAPAGTRGNPHGKFIERERGDNVKEIGTSPPK
jgi:hypothetical protein